MDRQRRNGGFPMLQVDGARIVGAIDAYIRTRLFGKPFDPFNGNDWKILLAKDGIVTQHIVKELARAIFSLQESTTTIQAEVHQVAFSTIQVLRMRESYSQPLQKTIYERTPFPSHGGSFEELVAFPFGAFGVSLDLADDLWLADDGHHVFVELAASRTLFGLLT